MTTEANKQLVKDFWASFSAADANTVAGLLADNARWQSMRVTTDASAPNIMDKAGILQLLAELNARIPNGLTLKMHGFTAEGNRVANEAECYGELTNGRIYQNVYHFLIEIEEGKIVFIKEYMDTAHATKTFC